MKRLTLLILFCVLCSSCFKEKGPYRTALLGHRLSNFDPVGLNEYNEITLISQICGRLTAVDEALNIEGDLAKSWTISSDRKTITFKIRTDRHYADGSSLKASDIKYSLLRSKETQASIAASWSSEIESVESRSSDEITITLKKSNPRALYLLSHPRFCILKEETPFLSVNDIKTPNSPGAYKIGSIQEDRISLELNPDFSGKALESAIEVHFLNQANALAEFMSQKLDDLSFYILSEQELQKLPEKSKIIDAKVYWTWLLMLNPQSHFFKVSNERQNFLESINRADLLTKWNSQSTDTPSIIPKGMQGYSEVSVTNYKGRGFDCRGKKLRMAAIDGVPSPENLRKELETQITQIKGCQVAIEFLEMGQFMNAYADHSYDLYFVGIDTNSTDSLGFYRQFVIGESENFLKYSDVRLSALYKKLYELSPELRKQSDYDDIQKAFYESHIALPLGHPVFKFAYSKAVSKMHMNPLGMHLNRWWKIGRSG